ncbi:PHB depolymerase family esterase [Noviherbaspirillum saxi]|uniref:PHA-depolymerase-like protein n=1 Tax=Noviherbaspirillum saxi TaxID=2320863 RepID=A0A3A3G6E8_9BURK|nr:PHB depolymerase family esterase [Noviherbaspirillum saxi]RJF97705.1 PHA-depolymerase-like protein [Noviherbaspirillum saxi]
MHLLRLLISFTCSLIRHQALGAVLLSAVIACLSGTACAAPVSLPGLHVDNTQTSVSGLSSGGFMAVQFSVAYSSSIVGAGIIAGGPYYCAQGEVDIATTRCSCTGIPFFSTCEVGPGSTNVDRLATITKSAAAEGKIDAVSGMRAQRLWLFSGGRDSVVPPPVMQDLQAYYHRFVPAAQVRLVQDARAEHTFPTESFGNDCGELGSPYLSKCGIDTAGELLKWIYGPLNPRSNSPGGRIIEFDQAEFVDSGRASDVGLADSGFAYVPAACDNRPGTRCRLHVAFHGCRQNASTVGDDFVRHAGYNEWADANRMVILYPQTTSRFLRNPNACWDWFNFGRNDPDYANRNGRQMRAVKAMVERLMVQRTPLPVRTCFTATNAEHVRAGRAYDRFLLAFAYGSNQLLGFDNSFTTSSLQQTGPTTYVIAACP